MAPSNSVPIDYQSLIHRNCLTFLGNDVDVYISTQVDSKGMWTAHVLKTEHGQRSAVFSESSTSLANAFEALHMKSAMAMNQFIVTNGFDLVPKISSRSATKRRDRGIHATSLDESEIISLDGETSSSSEEDEDLASDSEASLEDSLHDQGLRRSAGQVGPRPHMAVRRPEPAGNGALFRVNYERSLNPIGRPSHNQYRPPVGLPPVRPLPPMATIHKPLPPPAARRLQALPPPPPVWPRRLQAMPPRAEARVPARPEKTGVLLCITWVGHGELNVVDDCPLSVSHIQIRALQLVRTRTADFRDTVSVDFASVVLRAKIRLLHVAGTAYELGSFRDDLVDLFAGSSDFPRVEVEVTSTPAPPAAPASSPEGQDQYQTSE